MGIHDKQCELGRMTWVLLIRLQVVRWEGGDTQIDEQAIMAFDICDGLPLDKAFSLITKVHFLEMTVSAILLGWQKLEE